MLQPSVDGSDVRLAWELGRSNSQLGNSGINPGVIPPITTEANGLELGSIVRGGRSACLVNNTLYHQGDQIGNFMVVEIRPMIFSCGGLGLHPRIPSRRVSRSVGEGS